MIIKKALVFTESFEFKKIDVSISGEVIKEIGENLNEDVDSIYAEGCYLIPGFIDAHTHGCVGYDGCDADLIGYEKMSNFYASRGVTSFLFTTMTYSEEILENIIENISRYIKLNEGKAYSHGIYLEGPFINPEKKGAQSDKYIIKPDFEMFKKFQKISKNRIKVISLAPEMEGGLDFVKRVSKEVSVSIGHTKSDYITAKKAINNGANDITHLFNAMPSFLHRDPGVIGAAFDSDVFVEMICDGVHLHPSVIRSVFKIVGSDNVILISDSLRAAGMEDGDYTLGGQDVFVKNGKAVLKDGTIAGSTTNLFECVKNNISFGIPKEDVIKAATINPAKLIGADKVTGSIESGKFADLVLLDEKFNIKEVFIKGASFLNKSKEAYRSR